jgi:hypothetical protein
MIWYKSRNMVGRGFYWSPVGWEIVNDPRAGDVLPGSQDARYIRLPVLLLIVLGRGGKKLYGTIRNAAGAWFVRRPLATRFSQT